MDEVTVAVLGMVTMGGSGGCSGEHYHNWIPWEWFDITLVSDSYGPLGNHHHILGGITEKNSKALTTRSQKVTQCVGTRLLSGFLVSFASGVCGMELLDETTTIKYTETGGTYGYPNWLFGCSA